MFKGFRGHYSGADIDHELLAWTTKKLPWVTPTATTPRAEFPGSAGTFDCVICVSWFTHMTEAASIFSLQSLRRASKPAATLIRTAHGPPPFAPAATETRSFSC